MSIEQILRGMFPSWHFSRTFYEDHNVGELGWKVMISKQPEQFQDKALASTHERNGLAEHTSWLRRAVALAFHRILKRTIR